jgi:HEAT repeat protein
MKLEEILEGLSAPIKSFRVFALEQAIQSGHSPELLKALLTCKTEESDEECLLLLNHAIDAVQQRIEHHPGPRGALAPEEFSAAFEEADDQGRLRLLLTAPASLKAQLSNWAVEALKNSESPALTSQLIRAFHQCWPMTHLSTLLAFIEDPSPTVRFGVLEAMMSLCPFRIPEYLPELLKDPDPRVRASAIRALAKVDPAEAKDHMDAMLLGKLVLPKLAILQASVMIAFPLVKKSLLTFLAAENDLSLIEKAGFALQINPDPDVPYRLLELIERSREGKSEQLKKILSGSCRIIQDSGMMGDDFHAYLTSLKSAIRKRSALQSVQIVLDENAPEETGTQATERLSSSAVLSRETAVLREALQEDELRFFTPDQKKELTGLLKEPAVESAPLPECASPEDFQRLVDSEKIRWLALTDAPHKDLSAKIVSGVFQEAGGVPKLQAAALRAACRLQIAALLPEARKHVNSSHDVLVIAALEYLATFDPDKVQIVLGRLLKSGQPRIRGAAVRLLYQFDPIQAGSTLLSMLRTTERRNRQAAISSLMSFDFPLIRDQLVDLLETSKDQELLKPTLFLFQSNPHPDNLYQLYRLEKAFPKEWGEHLFAVRNANVDLIRSLRLMDPERLKEEISGLETRYLAQQNRRKRPPAYSFQVLKAPLSFRQNLQEALAEYQGLITLSGLMVLFLIGTGIFLTQTEGSGATNKIKVSGALLAESFPIQAVIDSHIPELDEVVITTPDHTVFQLRNNSLTSTLPPGARIKAHIRPFRITPGKIFARFDRVETW